LVDPVLLAWCRGSPHLSMDLAYSLLFLLCNNAYCISLFKILNEPKIRSYQLISEFWIINMLIYLNILNEIGFDVILQGFKKRFVCLRIVKWTTCTIDR